MWVNTEKVMGDYSTLYQRQEPTHTGRPVPTHVMKFRINNDIPREADVEAEVPHLLLNKAGGHMHLISEKFNKWLREAYPEEGTPKPPNTEI